MMEKVFWLLEELLQEHQRFALLQRLILGYCDRMEELMQLLPPAAPRQTVRHEDERPFPAGTGETRVAVNENRQ